MVKLAQSCCFQLINSWWTICHVSGAINSTNEGGSGVEYIIIIILLLFASQGLICLERSVWIICSRISTHCMGLGLGYPRGCDGNLIENSGSTLWNTFSRQVEFCSIRKSSFVQQFVIVRSLPEKRRKITKKKKKKWYLCFGRVAAAAAEGDTLSTWACRSIYVTKQCTGRGGGGGRGIINWRNILIQPIHPPTQKWWLAGGGGGGGSCQIVRNIMGKYNKFTIYSNR